MQADETVYTSYCVGFGLCKAAKKSVRQQGREEEEEAASPNKGCGESGVGQVKGSVT